MRTTALTRRTLSRTAALTTITALTRRTLSRTAALDYHHRALRARRLCRRQVQRRVLGPLGPGRAHPARKTCGLESEAWLCRAPIGLGSRTRLYAVAVS
jgi:hypothetical protein